MKAMKIQVVKFTIYLTASVKPRECHFKERYCVDSMNVSHQDGIDKSRLPIHAHF